MSRSYSPSQCHEIQHAAIVPKCAFRGQADDHWRSRLASGLHEVLGWQADKPRGPLGVEVLEEEETETYLARKLVFESEPGSDVPCHLLTPKGLTGVRPAFVCLQGHTTGMHISLGKAVYPGDENLLGGDRDFGIQAVAQGYIALVLEQRAFGERRELMQERRSTSGCEDAALHALYLGHTLMAERAWDVSRAIDLLETIPGVDTSRIGCMGNSGGGTATYYSACVEPRIYLAMPSCAFCTYEDSVFHIAHCVCNCVPGIMQVAEMGGLAGLIAPRRLIIVAGKTDDIFPIEGVRKAYATAEQIYAAMGAADRLRLVVGDGGHRFYASQGWAAVREML